MRDNGFWFYRGRFKISHFFVLEHFGVWLQFGKRSDNNLSSCYNYYEKSLGGQRMYTFKNANVAKDFYMMSSGICSIYELDENFEKNSAMVLGQLKYLFGEPIYITNNVENMFNYVIKATDEKGDSLLLEAFWAGSGPMIGGSHDQNSFTAANELALLIQQSPVVDYDYEGYYLDGPTKVRRGIKKGIPYWEETEISEAEVENFKEEVF